MTSFDMLFILLFLLALVTALTAGVLALAGKFDSSRRIFVSLILAFAMYMAVVIGVSLILPRRVIAIGELQCFDDWCITVEKFEDTPKGNTLDYVVRFNLSSRAKRVSQRENDLVVYLTDARGGRFDPDPNPHDPPFNVLLGPGESVETTRSFHVPSNGGPVSVAITHHGGFPIGWFIIGYDTWFRKPPIVKLS